MWLQGKSAFHLNAFCFSLFYWEKLRQNRFTLVRQAFTIVSQVILGYGFAWDFSSLGFLTFLHPMAIFLIKKVIMGLHGVAKIKVIQGL